MINPLLLGPNPCHTPIRTRSGLPPSVRVVIGGAGQLPPWLPGAVLRPAVRSTAYRRHGARRLQETWIVDAVAGQFAGHRDPPQPGQFGIVGAGP